MTRAISGYSAMLKYHDPIRVSCLRISCSLGRIVTCLASPMKATRPSRRVASSAAFCAALLPEQSTAASTPSPPVARRRAGTTAAASSPSTRSAPTLRAKSRRLASGSTPIARAPRALAAMIPLAPIGPRPNTATVVPPATPSFFIAL